MILAIIGTMITVWFGEALLADLDGISSQIFAVQFQQIKRTMHGADKRPMRANKLEHGEPFSSQTMASPSITHERAGSAPTARAMNGNLLLKSCPFRVISRTPALSRLARMRKPSCLISCIQSVPAGGLLAGLGRHGSTMPTVPRLRSDMICR